MPKITTNVIILSMCLSVIWATSALAVTQKPLTGAAVITGKIVAEKDCLKTSDRRPPDVWLSIGQILLYQVEVPVEGTFEFHVKPGKYDLTATNSKGCLAVNQLVVAPEQVLKSDLRLAVSRSPAGKAPVSRGKTK